MNENKKIYASTRGMGLTTYEIKPDTGLNHNKTLVCLKNFDFVLRSTFDHIFSLFNKL